LEREAHVALQLPVDSAGDALPFSTAEWFETPSGRGELLPVPVFAAPTESRAHAAEGAYPLEFLPRKADNFMNSTFANIPPHQRMEARTAGVLEMHRTDAAARAILSGDEVEVFNGRGSVALKALVNTQVSAAAVVNAGSVRFGNDLPISVIAGPCQLESRAHALEVAAALKEIASRLKIGLVYKTSFAFRCYEVESRFVPGR